ncbi:hypothetical protein PIB30_089444, partial [Stylosanthes scabra]|nr:hypothetical protein [Stylosanthes scabra]
MWCQVSVFEVRRCAFGGRPYGAAESYSREGVDVEVNSPRSPEIGLWDSRSNRIVWALGLARNIAPTRELETFRPSLRVMNFFDVFRVVLSTSGYLAQLKRDLALYIPATTCPLEIQALRVDVSFFFADVAEDFFSLWCSSSPSAFHLQSLPDTGLFIFEMVKKKSCQNVRNPRVLSPAERELYGWVDAEALEDRTHFLWVYVELFTRLGVRPPFSDFQREVLTRCRVAASQLQLNGWGFLRTFERVCLHFGFRPSWRIFLYTYQGRRLFDAFEESIQEFKWHYFKVFPLPGSRPFWLDDEGKPFPWVYWNSEARECRITALDPLETLAFDFLQSLPVSLEKRSNFRCRWILDHSDTEVGAFLDSLLTDMEKRSCYNRLLQKMAEAAGATPAPVASPTPVPPPAVVKKRGSSRDPAGKPFSVEGEEGAKEDPSADLKKKGRKRKAPEASAEEVALGADSAWEHKVSPINRPFPDDYNFRAALDVGLTNGPTREILSPLVPEQLLGTAQHLACQLTACHQVGIEKAFAAKVQMEKEFSSLKDQELEVSEGERLSALAHMKEVEEGARVQAAQLESCRSALEREKKETEKLAKSLKEKQTALDGAEAATAYWRDEWKLLVEETGEMVQENFEILMDQVRHLNPAIDYSMISLDTRWDPKAKSVEHD